MRILTLNMMHINCNLKNVRAFLNNYKPDICLLQEGAGILCYDSIKRMARKCYYYCKTVRMHGSIFCNWRLGIMTKLPLNKLEERELDTGDNWRRSALACVTGQTGNILLVTTHLGYDAGDQIYQIKQLLYLTEKYPRDMMVVAGDFNVEPDHPGIQMMIEAGFTDAWDYGVGDGMTFPSSGKRIDYIFVKGMKPYKTMTVLNRASDHLGVLAYL